MKDELKSAILPMLIFMLLIIISGLGNHYIDGIC